MIIATIVIANAVLFVLSRLIRRRQKRDRIFRELNIAASRWEEAGWIPVMFAFDGKSAVLTTRWRDSEKIELLVIE